jgi:type IV secretory pathway VirB2 component (pilin)
MKMKTLLFAAFLLISRISLVAAADVISIPADQPICRLYSIIQVLGTVAGVLIAAYAGFMLTSSNEISERNQSKTLLTGVILGLIIIWMAPLLVKSLVGAGELCGW